MIAGLNNKDYWDKQEEIRVEMQAKQYNYYIGSQNSVCDYLNKALDKIFSSNTTESMKAFYINYVKKIVDQKSVIYNKAATRYLMQDGKKVVEATKKYNKFLPKSINLSNKTAVKMAILSNVSLTQVLYDRDSNKIRYRVEPSYKYTVKTYENDSYKIKEVRYKTSKEINNDIEEVDVVWTEDLHYYEDINGNRYPVGDNVNMVNPIRDKNGSGIIPFAVLRINDGEDFWGEGLNDIVNANEVINLILTDLLDTGIVMGSATTPLAINLGLDHYIKDGKYGKKELTLGMKHPIAVEDARSNDLVSPSLQFVKPDVRIKEIMDEVERMMKIFAINHGLNPNSMTLDSNSSSGYSKMMDALDEIHIRESMIEQVRTYEDDLFNITRCVINTYNSNLIDWDYDIKVDFAEVNIPLSPQEWSLKISEEYKFNLRTPVDFLIDINSDLTREQAEKIIEENAKYNKDFNLNDFVQAVNVPTTELSTSKVNKQ